MKKMTLLLITCLILAQPFLPTIALASDAYDLYLTYENNENPDVSTDDTGYISQEIDNEDIMDEDDELDNDKNIENDDIVDFEQVVVLPQFVHTTPEIAQTPENVHHLTWNTIRSRYEVTLSDSAAMGGNQMLSYFLNLTTGADSAWFAPGLRVQRTGLNAIRIYAIDSTNPSTSPHTSPSGLLQMEQPMQEPLVVYFTVEVIRRPAFLEATMLSAETGMPIEGVVFELQRRNPTDTDWNPVVGMQVGTTDEYGVIRFEGLIHGRRYRVREISVPEAYTVGGAWRELTALPNQTIRRTFYSTPVPTDIEESETPELPAYPEIPENPDESNDLNNAENPETTVVPEDSQENQTDSHNGDEDEDDEQALQTSPSTRADTLPNTGVQTSRVALFGGFALVISVLTGILATKTLPKRRNVT